MHGVKIVQLKFAVWQFFRRSQCKIFPKRHSTSEPCSLSTCEGGRMNDCPLFGKWFGACKFEPRYSYGPSTWKPEYYLGTQGLAHEEAHRTKTYVHDVCVRCGRKSDSESAPARAVATGASCPVPSETSASVASNSSAGTAASPLPAVPASTDLCMSHARTTLRTAAANAIHELSSSKSVEA